MNHIESVNSKLGDAPLKTPRCSNLELYRILCMVMIVAHHYVVNSGLGGNSGLLSSNPDSINTVFLRVFGAWGKTGINCFLMITGYFMCTSQINIRKYLKLFLEILFYNLLFFLIFYVMGYETFSLKHIIPTLIPFWGFSDGFVNCFLAFYLLIPFLNILINNLTNKQHSLLLAILLGCYTFLGSIPSFNITFNYITWFCVVYLIASYIRLYSIPLFERRKLWGWVSLFFFALSVGSILVSMKLGIGAYHFVADCNKIFAVTVSVSLFLWFKNMNLKYSLIINTLGASTFGVLLIHANSSAMRTWLWKDTVDVVGHYNLPIGNLVLFSIGTVVVVFLICSIIDIIRINTVEKWFFNWYDNNVSIKADSIVKKLTKDK